MKRKGKGVTMPKTLTLLYRLYMCMDHISTITTTTDNNIDDG